MLLFTVLAANIVKTLVYISRDLHLFRFLISTMTVAYISAFIRFCRLLTKEFDIQNQFKSHL